ncbi:hypothetical protein SF23_02045 [Streptomyces sp. MBRL 10]|nr:hypothetical protein SF23_02045 [Streptomyces sp. MBRL 10]
MRRATQTQADVDQCPRACREYFPAPDEPGARRGVGFGAGIGADGQALQFTVGAEEGVTSPGQVERSGPLSAFDLAQVSLVVVERCGELGQSQPRFLS